MCGISCIVGDQGSDLLLASLDRSLRPITHRGHSNFQFESLAGEGFALGCHRLPFTSGLEPQPVCSPSGRYQVLLNGELYAHHNHTKSETQRSDTFCLAADIDQNGLGVVEHLDGMFAVVVFDIKDSILHLFRDRIGVKPLYYSSNSESFIANSELKGISRFEQFQEIHHVEPGYSVQYDLKTRQTTTARFAPKIRTNILNDIDYQTYVETIETKLVESVNSQTLDSRQYGLFLSGGVDSAAIYAIMHKLGKDVVPIVLGNEHSQDKYFATKLCNLFGQKPNYVDCPDELDLFRTVHSVIKCVESFEPNVVRQASLSMLLAEGAKSVGVDVALCGEGADELFGGYPEMVERESFVSIRNSFLADLHRTQLQRVDRTSMANTIEVRVPFLSNDLVSLALDSNADSFHFKALDGQPEVITKLSLRSALSNILPEEFRYRTKNVLSEGAGMLGNDPSRGLFGNIFNGAFCPPLPDITDEIASEWSLKSDEERFYFSIYSALGYDKYVDSKKRVFANAKHTIS